MLQHDTQIGASESQIQSDSNELSNDQRNLQVAEAVIGGCA
jgi:hypothetical protein